MYALSRPTLSRREVIHQAVLAGAGLALLPEVAFAGGWQADPGRELVPFEDFPENFAFKRVANPPLPGQDALGVDLRSVAWKTPVNDTFTVAHYGVPTVDEKAWKLTVMGRAGRPLTLTVDDLKKRPRITHTATFECGGNRDAVMNRMISNATWTGCSLKSLIEDARPGDDVLDVVFWAADRGKETIRKEELEMHFARSMSLTDVRSSDAILAYEVDGMPLPVVHGFPVRLLVPGWYGVANVKWLERIELSPRRYLGRFMGRDYVTIMGRQVGDRVEYTETSVTRQQIKSAVGRVVRGSGGASGLTAMGVAWTDGTPLQSVEVQVDGGPWRPARLEAQPSRTPYSWTFWSADVGALAPGSHTVASRATDRSGRMQPESLALKKSNWENNAIWTRKIKV